ncbi:PAS domain-containing methyl-accepting chemotaxis protein [Methylobacterium sp. J-067]|uniref:methyl-accepting chemotaxis protein n=1 Tax=Methylobacterium sp. J-067 TaxID=2836648 RepID=UPI001FB8DB86|nr:PAS domain-containing methyl-accepting chemotaxis protein [Methylobacterium sp. J-067]MCJ2026368.1 methyl-accepting chemotaxis protein [Methylobacterium sp. J-067]
MTWGWKVRSAGNTSEIAALAALRTNVMIADAAMNITYMNPALTHFMQEAEADLKAELPRFDAAKLIGSNIDIFHKDPSHQRRMLAALDTPHQATIRVGKRVFDLLVTPLSEGGKRIGFVVEWADAQERLLNLDYSAQIAAISRSQAVIEFQPDGTIVTANRNFLELMGYRLDEVEGKHHGIFVEPEVRAAREYTEFWDRLRRGEYQAAQFKRLARDGRPVWIEGSYNPILDRHGKVAKIVKFASDVTDDVKRLTELKVLIDENFAEVDRAVHLSNNESEEARVAAGKTSDNVQSVAAAAEELARSVDEIAASMSKARTSSDEAQSQTQAAGELTQKLSATATAMSGIVGLIQNIASQINLLALNATIESARAGEAGRGFAVVAQEVKNLANQASRATDQIAGEIGNVQAVSTQVVGSLETILASVETMRDYVVSTAAAVEQQSVVTRDMSANMQDAAGAVGAIAQNIGAISAAVGSVSQAVETTKGAARVLAR